MTVTLPKIVEWSGLDAARRAELLQRPGNQQAAALHTDTAAILTAVRRDGDAAVRRYTESFDQVRLDELALPSQRAATARQQLDRGLIEAIDAAARNIELFHAAQLPAPVEIETAPGLLCRRVARPLDSVGLYAPGGSAPLLSTVLMLGIPARLAGVDEVILCTPPGADGEVHPAVIVAAQRCGIGRIFRVGGAQAIAAMAYGTESVPRVRKIFGPGNRWVTAAKSQVAADPDGVAIDMPAGPSELMVIADAAANPAFVAADLLSQAEHGPDSQVLLISDDLAIAQATREEIQKQIVTLPRRTIATTALASSAWIRVGSIAAAIDIANRYAPEHLIVSTREAEKWLASIRNAGSVFLGAWTPESLGDYCSGTNHVLPTNGNARSFSGLSVNDFMRSMTVQSATPQGLAAAGPIAITLAGAEQLDAHARAVRVRLEQLDRADVA